MQHFFRTVLLLSALFLTGSSVKADSLSAYMDDVMHEFSDLVTTEDNCTEEVFIINLFEEESPFDHIIYSEYGQHLNFKKKKLKRNVSSYGIRAVQRWLQEPISTNISYGYSKPYFLHQLHSFLFRLTPF